MEDFVPFEIAQKLKEKGFIEECFARYYCSDKAYFERNRYYPNTESVFYCHNNDEDLGRFYVDAPTIAQVMKWLREEKLILIGLSPMQEYDSDDIEGIHWCAGIYKTDKQGGLSWKEELYYQSYEAAALAGIEYVLDNLI